MCERAPGEFEVRGEVPLGQELPRADVVLLRRKEAGSADRPKVLRRLWSLIARDAVMEFKSVAHGFRQGELGKLLAYTGLYYWQEAQRLVSRDNLLTVLLVPSLTPTLTDELAALGFAAMDEAEGYHRYNGGTFPLLVVEVDRAAESERDDLLGFLGHGTVKNPEAKHWLYRVTGFEMGKMKELDEFEDFEAKLFAEIGDRIVAHFGDKVLASMSPEQRLAGLAPEDVVRRYAPEELMAGLSEDQKAELRRLLDEQS